MKTAEHRKDEDGKTWREHRDLIAPVLIIATAFGVIALVWVLTGYWSYSEQTESAQLYTFDHPGVLFWSTDGFAIGCALLALAYAIDNRSAPFARLGVVAALSASAWFNAGGTVDRLGGGDWAATPVRAVVMAAAVPIVSWLALEAVILAIRATVRRWRGLPAPAAAPSLRPGRLLLGGLPEFRRWRRMYLGWTDPGAVSVTLADEIRAEVARAAGDSRALTRATVDALADSVHQVLRETVTTLLGSIPEPVQVPVPEVTRGDLTRLRDDLERAVRFDREAVLREAATAASTAAAETARAVAEEHRSTGTPRAPRTGPRTGTTGATKRDRYEQAYRSLLASGADPAAITGNDLAREVTGKDDARDDDGTGRKVLRDLRAADGEAKVLHLNGSRP